MRSAAQLEVSLVCITIFTSCTYITTYSTVQVYGTTALASDYMHLQASAFVSVDKLSASQGASTCKKSHHDRFFKVLLLFSLSS